MIPIAKPIIGDDEIRAVNEVLVSGMLAAGPKVAELERQFAQMCQSPQAVACSSGTAGLGVAVGALGLAPGAKALTTPFSFIATTNCILQAGLTPVFADVDLGTGMITADAVEAALDADPNIRAVLPVHLYGQPCEIHRIVDICRPRGVRVVEDAAQAHGASERGRPVGAVGDLAVFSLYGTKNMTTGEGGIITGSDEELLARCRLVVNQGSAVRYLHTVLGFNHRMTDVAAAIGLVQLRRLVGWNEERRRHAGVLNTAFADLRWLHTPLERGGCVHVYHQYVIRTDHRDALQRHLTDRGVGSAIHYPRTIPDQPVYQDLGYTADDLPMARRLADTVLALPVHPALSAADLRTVVGAVRSFVP